MAKLTPFLCVLSVFLSSAPSVRGAVNNQFFVSALQLAIDSLLRLEIIHIVVKFAARPQTPA